MYKRQHAGRSVRAYTTARSRQALYSGSAAPRHSWPGLALTREIVRAVRRSPIGGRERLLCWLALRVWVARNVRRLGGTIVREGLTRAGRGDLAVDTGLSAALRKALLRPLSK